MQAGGRRIIDLLREDDTFVGSHATKNLYQYIFSYVGSVTNTKIWFNLTRPELGACHGDELYYIFSLEGDSPLVTEEDKAVSKFMVGAWTNFAKNGNPNLDGGDSWPRMDRLYYSEGKYLHIDSSIPAPELSSEYSRKTTFWGNVLHPRPPVERTSDGLVTGHYLTTVKGDCVAAYQGIPYAKPPLGKLR